MRHLPSEPVRQLQKLIHASHSSLVLTWHFLKRLIVAVRSRTPQTIAAIHKAALSDVAISVVSGEKFAFELAVDYEFIPGVE
jgi:hypothetical protein